MNSNNIALELAKRILQAKLNRLNEAPYVGDPHGDQIEFVCRVADDGRTLQFIMKTWHELETEPDENDNISKVSFLKLQDEISRYCDCFDDKSLWEYIRSLPIHDEAEIRKSLKD